MSTKEAAQLAGVPMVDSRRVLGEDTCVGEQDDPRRVERNSVLGRSEGGGSAGS